MDSRTIRERIAVFPRWHYQFDLKGCLTPIFDPGHVNRHRQRRRHFFDPLVALYGGSLRGKRVIDLACNAGFWSLCAVEAGCDFVLGIDGRQMHVEQADLVFEANDVARARYRFLRGNVLDITKAELGAFDIVLCLGLLYHVNRPIELLGRISEVNTDLLVIDTSLCMQPGAMLWLWHEDIDEPRSAVECGLVFVPTSAAVVEMVKLYGYAGVRLRPRFDDYSGAEDFRDGSRRAFVCSRRTDLAPLQADAELVF